MKQAECITDNVKRKILSKTNFSGTAEDVAKAAAQDAGLRYTTDRQSGIHRKGSAPRFRYVDEDGRAVRDKETLARIKALVIPPAWGNVWICKHPNGHLQCTGRDARGRKQSRYHSKWRESRDEAKYERMTSFAGALPAIRRRTANDLKLPGMPREKVLATIVRLMEETLIRVGNEEYARTNKSYGLTTMRTRHVDVHGAEIRLSFKERVAYSMRSVWRIASWRRLSGSVHIFRGMSCSSTSIRRATIMRCTPVT